MQRIDVETTRDGGDGSLYDRFALPIFTYLCQQVSNEQDAEDLLIMEDQQGVAVMGKQRN